jgi:hypothetical protein
MPVTERKGGYILKYTIHYFNITWVHVSEILCAIIRTFFTQRALGSVLVAKFFIYVDN